MKYIAILALLFVTGLASAQSNVATQQVNIDVREISVLAIQGGPVSLVIDSATAGQELNSASATSSYMLTTNGEDKRITAELDSNMPNGITLSATWEAPAGAASEGKRVLTNRPVTLVNGITRTRDMGAITYEASATLEAGVTQVSRTVLYTVTDG